MTTLARINLLLVALLVAHTLDHGLNQPARAVPASGTAIALFGFVVLATSAVLAVRRSPLAPAAAVVAGLATALGTSSSPPAARLVGLASATRTGTSTRTRISWASPWRLSSSASGLRRGRTRDGCADAPVKYLREQ